MHDADAKERTPVLKECVLCGSPTRSRFAVCNREGTPCRAEYQRLWNQQQDKARRNEVARRYRHSQKTDPAVYAILFPAPAVLKVGLTTHSSSALYLGTARQGAKRRGLEIAGSSVIWKQPGDVRAEAWLQATLSFRWPGAFGKYQNRICEWFDVSGVPETEIRSTIASTYLDLPTDLTSPVRMPPRKRAS